MIRSRRLFTPVLAAIALLALFATFASPTYAAVKNRTFTEEQVNSRYWVTNPRSRAVSDRKIDLQPGQVVISETWKSGKKESKAISVTLKPTINNGRVEWNLASATVDGQAAPAELQKQIQNRVTSAWARYAKGQAKPGRITAVTITDSDISYTLETKK